jgi:hypothetical protein
MPSENGAGTSVATKENAFRHLSLGPMAAWRLLGLAVLWSGVLLVTPRSTGPAAGVPLDALLRRTARPWCREYGSRADLQIAEVEVRFHQVAGLFVEGEGIVTASVGIDLVGAQRILDVVTDPPMLRRIPTQGITAVSWGYAGRVSREMRFVAFTLVERPPRAFPPLEERPHFDKLPADVREEALAKAEDLEEHQLQTCADFKTWATKTAGDPPYPEQLLRLARWVGERMGEAARSPDDICAAIREQTFSPHRAQVLAVMAAREVGVPAFAFASASARGLFLVGTYTDQSGWMLIDLKQPRAGYVTGGDVLLTKLPLIGSFQASQHDFWHPEAAAFAASPWGVSAFSSTTWAGSDPGTVPTDTTDARSVPLSAACP